MTYSASAKKPINDWLYDQTKGVVQTGPFTGMKLLTERSWDDGSLGCQLLGTYEEELHDTFFWEYERLGRLANPKIVNVGCAEGYYAVGLARALPKATVWAVDVSEDAFRLTIETANANGVTINIKAAIGEVMADADLIVMDCEGYETIYLDFEKFPTLKKSTIIVECHDSAGVPITKILQERFSATHDIQNIIEGARNPNRFKILHCLHSLDRWAAVSEGRPCIMNWLVMRPK